MEVSNVANNPSMVATTGRTEATVETQSIKEVDTQPKTTTEMNKKNKEEIKEELNEAVENLNAQMDALNTNLKFGFNDKIDIMYVDVHEKSSGKLIRKFPSEEAMKMAEHMKEFVGILFDKKG